MGLQLVLGESGSGKSEWLYRYAIQQSQDLNRNLILVVPEQYTMETQKKIVNLHPRKGILNIDVVSFNRLAYKIFEEVGGQNRQVLDDTGKNLIVRKVLAAHRKELAYFGSNSSRQGFVSEVKSVLSELLQYNIHCDDLEGIIERMEKERDGGDTMHQQLIAKLSDIAVVYRAFQSYMQEKYITSEEILDVFCSVLDRSALLERSEIILDGFTGFTPVQYRLLGLLLQRCRKVSVSITIDTQEPYNVIHGMEELFFMSKDTIRRLEQVADQAHVPVEDTVYMSKESKDGNYRFANVPELHFLERNLFRKRAEIYTKTPEHIVIREAEGPQEELAYVIEQIYWLTRKEKLRYRDIAVVTGDIANYGRLAANMMVQAEIPCFIDYKRKITDNPFVEFVRSALKIIDTGFTYESMFRYLKTGILPIDRDEIAELENYCIALGIRGEKAWKQPWERTVRSKRKIYDMVRLNELRQEIYAPLEELKAGMKGKSNTIRSQAEAFYRFLIRQNSEERLAALAALPETGKEYEQLYRKVMDLLQQMVSLLGEEESDLQTFAEILDAGLEEIKIGLIPPSFDCVTFGDIERTRLDGVKVLFFVGVNDGIVPQHSGNKGILSEVDREYFEENQVQLAPSPRQKAFIQKFYLYLALTKEEQKLYLTYAGKDTAGNTILPSYLIRTIRRMFPRLAVQLPKEDNTCIYTMKLPKADLVWSPDRFLDSLSRETAAALYGEQLDGSISAFEKYASCQFAWFLQYGLGLEEREEFRFESRDFGNILHMVLQQVLQKAKDEEISIADMENAERKKMVSDCLKKIAGQYGNTILQDTSRNQYMIRRMEQLADRTVWAIGKQLAVGDFKPDELEHEFFLPEQSAEGHRLQFRGKIDRVDICEDEKNVYVRVVDYKTGKADFDLLQTYYSIKMQLMIYQKAALEMEQKRHPQKNVIPAGVFYFNLQNPMIEVSQPGIEGELLNLEILKKLRMNGVANGDPLCLSHTDHWNNPFLAVPVSIAKDGTVSEHGSHCMSEQGLRALEEYVNDSALNMTDAVYAGSHEINPYQDASRQTACTYCPYMAVCGFSEDLPGYQYRNLLYKSPEEIWSDIDRAQKKNEPEEADKTRRKTETEETDREQEGQHGK